ncbi:superfamily II DNA or RNA helicase [Massilia violacea]|uniref:Superfamily II DNA or RNA helicase n=1 Tax=Pseudoduganella violacea TaxID=1715466 RepID=A0A7W5B8V4_9BURK|nr:superfamily II DNA or RNA helicase [Pseudoduganella violacea]
MFTVSDVIRNFDGVTYARGRDYLQRGKIREVALRDGVLAGVVSGSGNQLYRQTVKLTLGQQGLGFDGRCSCPMEYNCKHVVAVLLRHATELDAAGPGVNGLSPIMEFWLQRVGQVAGAAPAPGPAPGKTAYRLIYVLLTNEASGRAELCLCKARLRADGSIGAASRLSEMYSLLHYPPAYVQVDDTYFLNLFCALRRGSEYGAAVAEPTGRLGAQVLLELAREQRLFQTAARSDLKTGAMQLLGCGPLRPGVLAWTQRPESAGTVRLDWQFADGAPLRDWLPTTPPLYVQDGQIGEVGLPAALQSLPMQALRELVVQAPPLSESEAAAFLSASMARGLAHVLPPPPAAQQRVRRDILPRPILRLGSWAPGTGSGADFAALVFDYDGLRASGDASQALQRVAGKAIESIERHRAAEEAAAQLLAGLGFGAHRAAQMQGVPHALQLDTQDAWLHLHQQELPALRALGWLVEMEAGYRYDVQPVEEWYADLEESNSSWFELELGIMVQGRRVALLPLLLAAIRQAPQDFDPSALAAHADEAALLLHLTDGKAVALPWARVKPILLTLGELYFMERIGPSLRLSSLDAARLAELEAGVQPRWLGGERLREMGRRLAAFNGMDAVAPPAGLQAGLRPYQSEGLAWMQFLRAYGLAGILADDMGLGKTIQTLAHILLEKEAGRLDAPALVVAPTSLLGNWQAEAARFAPGLRVLVLHGSERSQRFADIGQHDLVLTSYALLPRDEEVLRQQCFHLLILDESQYIKNSRSKAAQTAVLLQARHRLCLTGTPLQNHLGELWAQFHFLLPGLLGEEKQFNTAFRKPIEKQGDQGRNAFLQRRVKPFLLRRTKDAVATELPPKTEMRRDVELGGAQRDLYETVRLAMDRKVRAEIDKKGIARSQIVILEALLKLRQVCCDPRLVAMAGRRKSSAPSAKLNELTGMLEELLAEGRRILVFSQFTSMLELIEAELTQRGIAYALLTGETKDRSTQVARFQ